MRMKCCWYTDWTFACVSSGCEPWLVILHENSAVRYRYRVKFGLREEKYMCGAGPLRTLVVAGCTNVESSITEQTTSAREIISISVLLIACLRSTLRWRKEVSCTLHLMPAKVEITRQNDRKNYKSLRESENEKELPKSQEMTRSRKRRKV